MPSAFPKNQAFKAPPGAEFAFSRVARESCAAAYAPDKATERPTKSGG